MAKKLSYGLASPLVTVQGDHIKFPDFSSRDRQQMSIQCLTLRWCTETVLCFTAEKGQL